MKVYLDNNIVISIEDGEIELEEFSKLFETKPQFVYSYVHIQELLEANNLDSLTPKRIRTITEVTNNFYAYPDGRAIEFKIEDPRSVVKLYQSMKVLNDKMRSSVQNFNIDRDWLLDKLNINKVEINNISPDKVIEHLNKILASQFIPNFQTLILMAGYSIREQIASIFNFLDFLGYWTDKHNNKANLARMYDASHTYFSSTCDFFISNDKRARNKAKVVYSLHGIQTEVLSFKELLDRSKGA